MSKKNVTQLVSAAQTLIATGAAAAPVATPAPVAPAPVLETTAGGKTKRAKLTPRGRITKRLDRFASYASKLAAVLSEMAKSDQSAEKFRLMEASEALTKSASHLRISASTIEGLPENFTPTRGVGGERTTNAFAIGGKVRFEAKYFEKNRELLNELFDGEGLEP